MLFDIGVGILLGLTLSPFTANAEANIAAGIVFILLPDIDLFLYLFLKRTRIADLHKKLTDHREILHYPLPYMTIGAVLLALTAPHLIPIFLAGSFVQFAHDSIGVGWGIPWLTPFNSTRFKFLYQYDLHRAGKPQKFMWRWTKLEQTDLQKTYGDPNWYTHPFEFIQKARLWHAIEFFVFIIAIIIVIAR